MMDVKYNLLRFLYKIQWSRVKQEIALAIPKETLKLKLKASYEELKINDVKWLRHFQ